MKNEKDIQYLKWNKKLFGIFKKSCEKNLELHEAQVYQPYFSLYFNIHNTKHSHKLIDLKNEYQIEEIISCKSHKHYTSNSFTLCKLKNNKHPSIITKELFCKCIPLLDPLYFIKNNYNNIIHRNPLLPSCYNHNTFDKINVIS